MKHLSSIFFLLMIVATQATSAQNKTGRNQISGNVADDRQKPLDYATISLLKAKDSSLVKSALSDASGNFYFENVANGDYLVSAAVVGYRTAFSKRFSLDESNTTLKLEPMTLSMASKTLKEVTVTAQKPLIERKMDKLVVNVEGNSISAGSTALEVLEKAPGVTIDKDDNISMKGKQGVLIMLDGKATYLSNADVANMLRNMQSSQIESIELVTSPSAKYDAAGTSGIINIKTKKSKNLGLNGTLTAGAGYGQTSKYNGGTTLNYRNNKLNFFGNYNYSNSGRINSLNLNREVIYKDTTTNFKQLNSWDNRRYSNSYKAGADYFISKNHTLGILLNGYSNRNDENSISNTNWVNNFNQAELINVLGDNTEKYNNNAFNLNYKGTLDTTGKELSVDLDYSQYSGNQDEIRNNTYQRINLDPRGSLGVKNYAPAKINVKSAKIDYTYPINKTTKLEAGLKSSFVTTDNDLLLAKQVGNTWVADPNYTNHFVYDENINAAYLNYSKEIKKTGIQLGLRAEQTNSKGNSITKSEVVKRHYLELFPSLSVSQKLDKNNDLGFSYSRRIDRPSYDNLNPFVNFLDEYTYKKGNPFLNPQFTSSLDLSHTYKGKFTTSLNYSHTKDVMTTVTEQEDETKKTFATERNLDEQEIWGLNVYAPFTLAKWWNMNNNLQVFNMKFKSASNGGSLSAGQTAVSYNMDNTFNITKSFGADMSAQYQSPLQYGIFKIQSQLSFNAGLRKSFANNKMNLRLSMSDVFNTRRQRLSTTYQNMNLNFTEKGETQVARLTLNYRFGKNEIKPARRRSTGLEDEQNRMKN
ncbi:MAG: hypothetical protein K0S09_1821 [Sphingobacteriaceae bacterium]|jgi:hypothetical protein|nr:hypothetical protein [Sphingobacteriaceae bacterium]